jgi:hypothetical protein
MSLWDTVVSQASDAVSKAATAAGSATQTAAQRAKLHADLLVIDRDITARKEKFGVDMYAHLEAITSTQEFYVADDKLINILRPTLIKAQREVAAYEKKRDAMRGKVNLAEANRSSTGSILAAETMGQKLFNAASFLSAGAKEAACKTELAMLERQIRGFKEEFGVELYPVFQSMEDNEGWLPTDRKVRSLYDQAREDIAQMEKSKEEKREQIRQLEGVEGSGLTPPTVPVQSQSAAVPMAVATPVATSLTSNYHTDGQAQWAGSAAPDSSNALPSFGTSYGSSQPTTSYGLSQPITTAYGSSQPSNIYGAPAPAENTFGSIENKLTQNDTGFGFLQNNPPQTTTNTMSFLQPTPNNMGLQQTTSQFGNNVNTSSVFDPFDGLSATPQTSTFQTTTTFNATPAPAPTNKNAFDPFSNGSTSLSDADMNLFKY